jgi:transposase
VVSTASTDAARQEPGTLDDLISDAAAVGLDFNERLARDWHRRGLLGSPTRQPLGRGRGSDPAIYSPEQRELFQAIARNRAARITLKTLAALPVWAWLHRDGWVELPQLRRALATAVGNPRLSGRVAHQSAQQLLGLLDHGYGRPDGRRLLRDELVRQLQRGRIDERALLPKVRAVFEPSSITVIRGPAGAGLSAEAVTSMLSMRLLAAVELRRARGRRITDEQLLTARQQHLSSISEYRWLREALATQAASLAQLFEQPTLQEEVLSSVRTLLYQLGLQLRRRDNTAQRARA